MKHNNEFLEALLEESVKIFPEDHTRIEEKARTLYLDFCKQEEGKPKEITMHTVRRISIIGWVSDAENFYRKAVGAEYIKGGNPENSVYSNLVFM